MRVVLELDFPVRKYEMPGLPYLPVVGDRVHTRSLIKGTELFKVIDREFDLERNMITIFVKGVT